MVSITVFPFGIFSGRIAFFTVFRVITPISRIAIPPTPLLSVVYFKPYLADYDTLCITPFTTEPYYIQSVFYPPACVGVVFPTTVHWLSLYLHLESLSLSVSLILLYLLTLATFSLHRFFFLLLFPFCDARGNQKLSNF